MHLNRVGPAGLADTMTPPSRDAFKRTIVAGICPWCHAGPFHAIALHTNRAHGVSAAELREIAGMFKQEPLTSPEYHARRSEIAKRNADANPDTLRRALDKGRNKKRNLSQAARQLQREKAARVTDEQRAENARRAAQRHHDEMAGRDASIIDAIRSDELTYVEIAHAHAVHPRTVREIARRNGIDTDGRKREALIQQRRRDGRATLDLGRQIRVERLNERAVELVQAFTAGSTVYELAEMESMTVKAMRALLRRHGADVPDGRSDPDRPIPPRPKKPRRTCSIDGCESTHRARGLCSAHYQRAMKGQP